MPGARQTTPAHWPAHWAASWLLISFYAATAIFGWSLHALLPCGNACCDAEVVRLADAGCGCSGHRCHAPTAPAEAGRPGLAESPAPDEAPADHDPHDCSVCLLMAQLKAGHTTPPVSDFTAPVIASPAVEWTVTPPAEPLFDHSARGPPAVTLV